MSITQARLSACVQSGLAIASELDLLVECTSQVIQAQPPAEACASIINSLLAVQTSQTLVKAKHDLQMEALTIRLTAKRNARIRRKRGALGQAGAQAPQATPKAQATPKSIIAAGRWPSPDRSKEALDIDADQFNQGLGASPQEESP